MKKIGMIGLGAMGHSIAQNIMKNGYSMVLYDIRPEAFADLVEQGAEGAASLQELGEKVSTVLMMVNTYPQCCSVMESLLETLKDGVIIEDGPHAELVKNGGEYAGLWERQTGAFEG